MDFSEARREYERLKQSYQDGLIGPELFQKAVKNLIVIDQSGQGWQIGINSGRWYHRDEAQGWISEEPAAVQESAAEPPETLNVLNVPLAPPERLEALAPPVQPASPTRSSTVKNLPPWAWIIVGGGLLAVLMSCLMLFGGTALFGGLFAANLLSRGTPAAVSSEAAVQIETATPTLRPTRTLQPTVTATPDIRFTQTTPTRASTPSTGLSTSGLNGPWLLMRSEDELLAAASDGSNPTVLETGFIAAPQTLARAISPVGGRIAYVVEDEQSRTYSLRLKIIQLPGGQILKEIPLLSSTIQEGEGEGERSPEAVRSITETEPLAWSPDGESLAFIGIMDGTSADLYLYSIPQDEVTRLSSETSQAFGPSWSKDGGYIVYFGADSFGDGTEFEMTGAWAARPAVSGGINSLYTPDSSGEDLVGWSGLRDFIVSSWTSECGSHNLRQINIETGKKTELYSGCFSEAALDPETGTLVFTVSDDAAMGCLCQEDISDPGVFLIPDGKGLPRSLISDSGLEVRWQPDARLFYALTENLDEGTQTWLSYTPDEEEIDIPENLRDVYPAVSPVSGWWAWARSAEEEEPGLWVGDIKNRLPRKVFEDGVDLALWNADGKSLLFFSGLELYSARETQFEAVPKTSFPSSILQAAWVRP